MLKRLILPIYLPLFLEYAGVSAYLPLLPLIAVRLGFSVPEAAALGLIQGLCAVLLPIPLARLLAAMGERRALLASGALQGVTSLGLGVVVHRALAAGGADGAGPADRLALIAGLLVINMGLVLWHVGRQAYLADALPESIRARGLTTLGGALRMGQVVGPFIGAAVIAAGSTAGVFFLHTGLMVLATVLVALTLLPLDDPEPGPASADAASADAAAPDSATPDAAAPGTGAPDAAAPAPLRRPTPPLSHRDAARRRIAVAAGILPVSMSRSNRMIIIPLVALSLGLGEDHVAIVVGIAAVVEIALFYPAGLLMDRFGRAAVAVPCSLGLAAGMALMAPLALGGHATTPQPWALPALLAAATVMSLGNGLGSGIQVTLGVDLARPQYRVRDLGRWNSLVGVGQLAGPGLVTAVTVVAPVGVAAGTMAVLCGAGGAWLARILPRVTPAPSRR
ncbi:MFS transporter [Helcobacillus massiliensis]|uniref:MFS transporter n=1 Tax=Helcobacillus massiliensis TaxID=521392 RepID=UPI002557238E|nr:MFS transporter [Helcobacillus massiliensis]MDK7743155.1 MFS transporter [Helcobacillus massiliensis]WOO93236.1 MFS transporter [Helcobacillus massiliensis]